MTEPQRVLFELRDQVATLTLNNPDKRNPLDMAMREQLGEAVQRVRRDPSVRAVILSGAGGHFCSGGDLRNIASAGLDNAGWRARMQNLHVWLRDLLTLDRPVIAAVDGAAAGAGFSLALCADFVLATPRARFCMSFLKVGVVPDAGAFFTLPQVVGMQRARELMLSARDVEADEALRLGIAMELHAPEDLLPRARALAASFVHASPLAVGLIKRTLAQGGPDLHALLEAEACAQALAMGSPEHKQAVADFLARKPLAFQWPSA